MLKTEEDVKNGNQNATPKPLACTPMLVKHPVKIARNTFLQVSKPSKRIIKTG